MEPTRILPDLQCSLPCEDVRQEITGNFVLVGVLGLIRVTKLPVTATKLCLFNRWTAGLGEFTETARLLAPDQSTPDPAEPGEVPAPRGRPAHHQRVHLRAIDS